MAAVPATERLATALEQSELLERSAAQLGLADGEALVRRIVEDYAWATGEARAAISELRVPFDPQAWELYPSAVDEEVA